MKRNNIRANMKNKEMATAIQEILQRKGDVADHIRIKLKPRKGDAAAQGSKKMRMQCPRRNGWQLVTIWVEVRNSESFTTLLTTTISSSNMHKLGISMGSNDNEIQLSVMSLKNIEIDRLSVFANKLNKSKNAGSLNRVISFESDAELVPSLTHICRDRYKEGPAG
jgi:hypothetical protein